VEVEETDAEIDDEIIPTNLSFTVAANINLKPNDTSNDSKLFVEDTTREGLKKTDRRNPRFLLSNYNQKEF
jgi:hypothetical protein